MRDGAVSDEGMNTDEFFKVLQAKGESLEGLLSLLMCEVHNQLHEQLPARHNEGTVGIGTVRRPVTGVDVDAIAETVQECLTDTTIAARLVTLALLNMMGVVEWT